MALRYATSRALWFFAALAVLLAASSVVMVEEGEQVVIARMGEPVRVANRFRAGGPSGAGVVLKLPFAEQAVHLSRGLKGYSAGNQKVRSSDGQDLLVDADVTYRIIDPVRLVNRLGTPDRLEGELASLVGAILGGRLSPLSAAAIGLPGSAGAAPLLRADLDSRARALGVQVVDFRIGRVMPGDAAVQMTFDTMQARHLREADEIAGQQIASARQTRAQVAAEAAGILQASAGKDPEFYDFWRGLRSYTYVFENPDPKNPPTIVIPPGSSYLRHFNGARP
jgi:membrane protease subunit HflC